MQALSSDFFQMLLKLQIKFADLGHGESGLDNKHRLSIHPCQDKPSRMTRHRGGTESRHVSVGQLGLDSQGIGNAAKARAKDDGGFRAVRDIIGSTPIPFEMQSPGDFMLLWHSRFLAHHSAVPPSLSRAASLLLAGKGWLPAVGTRVFLCQESRSPPVR